MTDTAAANTSAEAPSVVVESEEVPFRSGSLVVRRAGTGPTVGFLHGMIGSAASHPLFRAVAGLDRQLVAPSLPGFSGSPACEDMRFMHDWVVATSEAIDLSGLTGGPIVAGSVGAMLALELAAVRPEAFSHLTLVSPLGLWDDDEPVNDPFATTLSAQRRLLTSDPAVTASFFDDPDGVTGDDLIEVGIDRYQTRTASASLVWPIPDHGLASRIHRVTAPVTLVFGSEDQILPSSYQGRFEAALPNIAASHVIDGAGHLVAWDRPDEIAAIVADVA